MLGVTWLGIFDEGVSADDQILNVLAVQNAQQFFEVGVD